MARRPAQVHNYSPDLRARFRSGHERGDVHVKTQKVDDPEDSDEPHGAILDILVNM